MQKLLELTQSASVSHNISSSLNVIALVGANVGIGVSGSSVGAPVGAVVVGIPSDVGVSVGSVGVGVSGSSVGVDVGVGVPGSSVGADVGTSVGSPVITSIGASVGTHAWAVSLHTRLLLLHTISSVVLKHEPDIEPLTEGKQISWPLQ